ncbi:MAG: type IV pili methyl-accepting chemotaxis transducer N-terminal domain-containing protein, partial [Bacteroidota bacterium]
NIFEWYKHLDMRLKLGIVLLTFGVVGLLNFFSVTYFKKIQELDTAVVDAAGRQRMLSQRIAFFSEQIFRGRLEVKDKLKSALDLCDISLQSLKNGGVAPGIANNIQLPRVSNSVLPTLQRAETSWEVYREEAEVFVNDSAATVSGITENNAIIYIENNAADMLAKFNDLVKAYVSESQSKQSQLGWLLLAFLAINAVFVWLGFLITSKYVREPILQVLNHVSLLSQGNLGQHQYKYVSSDEIGTAVESLKKFDLNLLEAAKFAQRIGEGQYDYAYHKTSDSDKLGGALLEMRDKLLRFSDMEKKQSWTTKGIAYFSDILRSEYNDVVSLSSSLIKEIVKYMSANQGALFILNEDAGDEPLMELVAAYAWDRQKYLTKNVKKGHGVTGQIWLEGRTWYMTEIPQNYINIRSGLGDAVPSSICILPLKVEDKVLGILEIASFNQLEQFQIDFLEELGQSIASTLENAKVAERTRALLKASQQQTEQLRSQEEEMRQNQEELQSTQEEMERQKAELEMEILKLNKLLHR